MSRPSWARVVYRRVRKRAKRLASAGTLAGLAVRNLLGRRPVCGDGDALVSLTSYGSRIGTVAYTVESIAAGSVRPSRLVLWLDDPAVFARMPSNLRRLQRRGLEVRLTSNLGPHTKYFPSLPLVSGSALRLVTADDDLLYPRRWLSGLLDAAARHPEAVNCYRASVVALDAGGVAPYAEWPRCRDTAAAASRFATGVSGVVYPTAAVQALIEAGDAFLERCPTADDIWLHWVELRAGIPVRQISPKAVHFPYIPGTQKVTLVSANVGRGGNDRWIEELYTAQDVDRLRSGGAVELPPSGTTTS